MGHSAGGIGQRGSGGGSGRERGTEGAGWGGTRGTGTRNGTGTRGDRDTERMRTRGDRDTGVAPEPRRDLTLAAGLSHQPPNTEDLPSLFCPPA